MSTVVVCLGASPWCRFGILQHIMSTGHVCLGASPWRRFGILQHIMSTGHVCLGASPWRRFGILQHIMSTGHVCPRASPWRRFGILQHIMSTRRIFAWGHHRYCLSLESRKTRPAPISARRAPPDDSNRFTIPYLLPLSNRCHPPFQSVPPTFFTPATFPIGATHLFHAGRYFGRDG